MKVADITPLVVASLRKQYVTTQNALYVWQAYQWVRRARNPIPGWVAEYLDNAAAALSTSTEPAQVAAALGLAIKGGTSKAGQIANADRDGSICSCIDFLMRLAPDDLPDDMRVADWLFKPLLQGETRLGRICDVVAEETRRKDNGFKSKPLASETIQKTYLKYKIKS